MIETKIYLIRHAQSHPSTRLHNSEWPLSAVGQVQAEKLGDLLEPLGIEILFSSPFARCLQTIQSIAGKSGLDVVVVKDLRERVLAREIVRDFQDIWRRSWDDFNFALPGGESSFDAQHRFVAAVADIFAGHSNKTIGISTHGNVMGLFLNHIDCAFGREQAEGLRNPDVLRVMANDRVVWDREFRLPGLENIATNNKETPAIDLTWDVDP